MAGVEAIGGQDSPVFRLRIYLRQLRHIIRILLPAAGFLIPVHAGQQPFLLQEKCIHQPGKALYAGPGPELRVFPVGIQLPLLHRVLHGQTAPEFHSDIFHGNALYRTVRQPHNQYGITGIRIGDFHIADFYICHSGHMAASAGIGEAGKLPGLHLSVPVNTVSGVVIIFFPIINAILFHNIRGIHIRRFLLADNGKSGMAVNADDAVFSVRRGIPFCRITGIFLPGGKHPVPVIQTHISFPCFNRFLPAVSRHRKTASFSCPDKNRGTAYIFHLTVCKKNIRQVRAVHRFQCEAAGPLKADPSHRHLFIAAGGFRTQLHPSRGAASVGSHQLFPGVYAGGDAPRIVAAHTAVLNKDIFQRHEFSCAVGRFHDQRIVGKRIKGAVSDGHILAAVHIQRVSGRIHQDILHQHIFHPLRNDGKMAAYDKLEALQHHIFTAKQGNRFIAEPFPVTADSRFIAHLWHFGIAAQQHIAAEAVLKTAAVNQALSINHYV